MTTLDIPPPPFSGHRDPLDGTNYVMLSANNRPPGDAADPVHPPLRPPPYRRSLRVYFSRRRSSKGRRCCRTCLCCCCCFLFLVIFLFAALLLFVRFAIDPKVPSFKVDHFDVKAFNLHPASSSLSMELAITVRAGNPNEKIGIRYRKGGWLTVGYHGTKLGSGQLPVFYQRPRNTTVMVVKVRGRSTLGAGGQAALLAGLQDGAVQLHVQAKAPLGIAVTGIELVKVTAKINCTVTVDSLSPGKPAKVKSTQYNVDLEF